jgi:hypothetical protein
MALQTARESVPTPRIPAGVPLRLATAGPSLWRVIDRSGLVIGHLQGVRYAGGVRFRARRFHAASRAFRDLGEFWSADDALDCVRFAR